MPINSTYYLIKPLIPRRVQIYLRKKLALRKRSLYSNSWPIDEKSAKPPIGWSGWPNKKQFALVLTHDVDTLKGHDKCYQLITLEKTLGFRSSFNFVPEGYNVSSQLRDDLTRDGFEVGVHGLTHRGNLFKAKRGFHKNAIRINHYLQEWGSFGFRAPSMYHNLEWIHHLEIEYDASTFDTDPFEPQPDGVGTLFPFWVQDGCSDRGYMELPYTLPQDFTLYILMEEKNINIWKQKLDWIIEKGGMALLNTHPDYMNFDGKKLSLEEYPVEYYKEFLDYIKSKYEGQYWHVLPKDLARFLKDRYKSKG